MPTPEAQPDPHPDPGPADDPPGRAISPETAGGDSDRMLGVVYDELRALARQRLRHEPPGLTLQATALVHEAYMRLVGDGDERWSGRGHFFGAAALAMRRILVERARRYASGKHGGGRKRMPLDAAGAAPGPDRADARGLEAAEELLALDEAFTRLEQENPVRAQVVALRYFAGLTIEQTAEALGVSPVTVTRHWTCARAWLFHEIEQRSGGRPDPPS